jgi:hypothetical protein
MPHIVVYIDTGSPVPNIPSISCGLVDENKRKLTEWKWFETSVLEIKQSCWNKITYRNKLIRSQVILCKLKLTTVSIQWEMKLFCRLIMRVFNVFDYLLVLHGRYILWVSRLAIEKTQQYHFKETNWSYSNVLR